MKRRVVGQSTRNPAQQRKFLLFAYKLILLKNCIEKGTWHCLKTRW